MKFEEPQNQNYAARYSTDLMQTVLIMEKYQQTLDPKGETYKAIQEVKYGIRRAIAFNYAKESGLDEV